MPTNLYWIMYDSKPEGYKDKGVYIYICTSFKATKTTNFRYTITIPLLVISNSRSYYFSAVMAVDKFMFIPGYIEVRNK